MLRSSLNSMHASGMFSEDEPFTNSTVSRFQSNSNYDGANGNVSHQHNHNPPRASSTPEAPSQTEKTSPQNTLIILDWDDTLFPTSALERSRLLRIPAKVRPQVQSQLNALASVCEGLIKFCENYGKVMIITNSAPGWIEASCAAFMPTLLPKMRTLVTFAKPMSYLLTFKLDVFQRECPRYSNIISIGDGIAERTATLRLCGSSERFCKSLKLKDLPTMAQLTDQLHLTQQRWSHVCYHHGDLDLRSQFGSFRGSAAMKGKPSVTFVHLTNFETCGGRTGSHGTDREASRFERPVSGCGSVGSLVGAGSPGAGNASSNGVSGARAPDLLERFGADRPRADDYTQISNMSSNIGSQLSQRVGNHSNHSNVSSIEELLDPAYRRRSLSKGSLGQAGRALAVSGAKAKVSNGLQARRVVSVGGSGGIAKARLGGY